MVRRSVSKVLAGGRKLVNVPMGAETWGCVACTLSGACGSAWPLTLMTGMSMDWDSEGYIVGCLAS